MESIGRAPEPDDGRSSHGAVPSAEETAWLDREIEKALSRIHVPEPTPATPEELARRREVFARITRLRDQIGPISVPVAELIRELRGWPEEDEPSNG